MNEQAPEIGQATAEAEQKPKGLFYVLTPGLTANALMAAFGLIAYYLYDDPDEACRAARVVFKMVWLLSLAVGFTRTFNVIYERRGDLVVFIFGLLCSLSPTATALFILICLDG